MKIGDVFPELCLNLSFFFQSLQVFFYINERASLYDTTSSAKGYHQVEDKPYTVNTYEFETQTDVEKYWYQMYEICVYTPLGGSMSLIGKEITLEVMDKKPAMIETLQPKTNEEAKACDQGNIPGDHLGPAGLDSSIFAYLKRNWTWNSRQSVPTAKPAPQSYEKKTRAGKKVLVTMEPNLKRSQKGQKRKRPSGDSAVDQPPEKSSKSIPFPKTTKIESSSKPSKYTRVLQKRKPARVRKPYYDEKDRAALRLMRKLRVEWTDKEDSYLLLCKVAGTFLCQSYVKNQMVSFKRYFLCTIFMCVTKYISSIR